MVEEKARSGDMVKPDEILVQLDARRPEVAVDSCCSRRGRC